MKKKIITKKQFQSKILKYSKLMNKNKLIFRKSINLLEMADKYMFIHQNKYFGEPSLNLGDDLMRIQEIIYKVKPDYVVEIGTCWGGTTLFLANVLYGIGKGKVIGIDIFIPNSVKRRILKNKNLRKIIDFIQASSTEEKTFNLLKKKLKDKKSIFILDSDHTEKHVLNELKLYSKLIKKNCYIVVCDTLLKYINENKLRKRAWTKKNNPMTAVEKFLKENKNFQIDEYINNKLLLSCNYNGFLKRIK